jgi:hypothetical protein
MEVNTTAQNTTLTSTVTIPLNTWTHLVSVIDNVNLKAYFYINGVLATAPVTMPYVVKSNPARALTIGTYWVTGYEWNGILDDVRIYNHALSGTEVKSLYNMGR